MTFKRHINIDTTLLRLYNVVLTSMQQQDVYTTSH